MPKRLERKLSASAHKLGLYKTKGSKSSRRRYGAYVYGGLREITGYTAKRRGGHRRGKRR